jgi:hypothetical protein
VSAVIDCQPNGITLSYSLPSIDKDHDDFQTQIRNSKVFEVLAALRTHLRLSQVRAVKKLDRQGIVNKEVRISCGIRSGGNHEDIGT